MRSIVRPGWFFDCESNHRLFFFLVLLSFLLPTSVALAGPQEASDEPQPEVATDSSVERLRAGPTPSEAAVEDAVFHIYLVLAIAGIGIILIFIGTAVFYSEPSWTKPYRPTEVKRAPGVEPKPRGERSAKQVRYRIDE